MRAGRPSMSICGECRWFVEAPGAPRGLCQHDPPIYIAADNPHCTLWKSKPSKWDAEREKSRERNRDRDREQSFDQNRAAT